jgi:hypothetical protein
VIVATEVLTAIEGTTAPLERVHDIERGDRLALGVLGVGDAVSDNLAQIRQSHPPRPPGRLTPSRKFFNTARVSS